jgi:thiamine biosynthesis lipoprotein
MRTINYLLRTAVIDKMTIPFTIRIALTQEPAFFADLFQRVRKDIDRDLTRIDDEFSPFKATSLLSQFRAGDLSLLESSARFAEVFTLAQAAQVETAGYFDPHFDGDYNPTGLVKGWAINRIFDQRLRPLLRTPEIVGVSLNGGGDIMTAIKATTDFRWGVGIANPLNDSEILGKYDLANNGIATSGLSRRGEHIRRQASSLQQVTIVDESLLFADIWATAGMAAGTKTLLNLAARHQLNGVLVDEQLGVVHFSKGVSQP